MIPTNSPFITIHMGHIIDYFRPISGYDYCDMLKSNDKHEWSADGINWVGFFFILIFLNVNFLFMSSTSPMRNELIHD